MLAAMSIIRPHRDVELDQKLASVDSVHQNYNAKLLELTGTLDKSYAEAGIKSPRLLFPGVGDVKDTLSLFHAEHGAVRNLPRLYDIPNDLEGVENHIKVQFV